MLSSSTCQYALRKLPAHHGSSTKETCRPSSEAIKISVPPGRQCYVSRPGVTNCSPNYAEIYETTPERTSRRTSPQRRETPLNPSVNLFYANVSEIATRFLNLVRPLHHNLATMKAMNRLTKYVSLPVLFS